MGRFTKPISSDKCKSARSNSIATHCRTGAATSTSTHSRSTALSFKISEDDKLGITASSGRGAVLLGEPGDDDEEDDDEGDGDDDDDEGGDGSLLRKLSRGVVPLAASLGFTAVPSSRLALRLAGAAAGGVVGAVIRSVIRKRIRERELRLQGQFGQKRKLQIDARVQKALDRMMQDPNVIDMELQTMESIAKDAKVPEDLLTELFTRLFAEVVYDAVVNSEQQVPTATGLELTELSSVRDFAVDIGLSVHEIGCGFSLAALKLARQLKKDESGFYSADFPMELPYQAAKLFFLGDKMIGKSDGFYGKRLHSCLSFFVHDDYRKIVTSACTNIFRRYIEGVFLSPEDYSTDLTASLKEFLATSSGEISTLRAADMQNMVLEAIQFSLDRSLPDDVAPLDMRVENIQVLRKAQQVLGWDARELAATVELRTAPKYLQAVRDLLERVQSDPSSADGLAHVLEERAAAFGLARSKARDIVLEVISEKNAEYMDRINNIYEASGKQIGPTYKIMVKYAHTHAAFQKLAAGLTSEVKEIPIPGLPFVQGIRASMYQLQLDKGLGDGRGVSPEMFELREDQRAIVERQLVLPKVSSWVAQCITEGTFNDDAKQAYRKLLGQYGVDEEEWKASAVDFYYQECSRIAKSRQIPTSDDMQRLAAVKAFLDCDDAAVDRVNLELLGDKYVKALTEAMTPTGIITPEYAEGLERLRLRLGLTEENAQKLLSFSIQSRVAPAVQSLIDVWKSDTDAKYRREKEQREAQEAAQKQGSVRDKSRDNIDSLDSVFGYMEVGAQKEGGGPNVFMRDCLNVVDIVMENCGMQNVTDLESLPVNAAELAPPGDLAGVYKHFLITRLAERDEGLRARYLSYEPMFAKILGIDESNQRRVKRSLAYTSYKNMLKSILRVKPQVEATDIQQFFILKDFLPLEEDVAEKVSSTC